MNKSFSKTTRSERNLRGNTNQAHRVSLTNVKWEKSENYPLNAMLSQGQSYTDNPQAATLFNDLGLLTLHKYISIHYRTKFAMLIGFAFNNQSSFSRLTHL